MRRKIILGVSLSVVLFLNIYYRCFDIYFPQLKKQAQRIMDDEVRKRATQDIYNKYPQYNPLAKERLIKSRISDYKKASGKAINTEAAKIYNQIKDKFQDKFGNTYLLELDPWHWSRYVDNIVRLGHPGDEVIYGKQWDLYMLAPNGSYMHSDQLLFYLSAGIYEAFSIFKKVDLFHFIFYLPLLYTAIFIIILYFFAYRYGGNIAAVTSCLFIGLAPICLQRSCAGWFKRDILTLLFPVLIFWAYLKAFESVSMKVKVFWLCLSGFFVGLFAFTWIYWLFIFFIFIVYEIFSMAVAVVLNYKQKEKMLSLLKQRMASLVLFISSSLLSTYVLAGTEPFEELYKLFSAAFSLNQPIMATVWPNVFSTVGELRAVSFQELAYSTGNKLFFISAVVSISILIVRSFTKWRYNGIKRESVAILALWFFAMLFACTRGARFVIYIIVPLGISLGWVLSEIFEYAKSRYKVFGVVIVAAAIIFLWGVSAKRAESVAEGIYPLMDDTWYSVLTMIKEKTTQDTVINSWWDFGDWFKVVAGRRVIFDGQSQNLPQAYWMAKAMLTPDENQSIRILAMLNNGGNRAFEIIDKYLKDELQSVLLLESLMQVDSERAKQMLLEFVPLPDAENVLKILYTKPGKAVFVADFSMPSKMVAISYLGNWNFSKVYMAQNFQKLEKDQILERLKKLGRDPAQMQNLYQEAFLIQKKDMDDWISDRLQFYSNLVEGHEKDGAVFFENGFVYNPKEQLVYSNSGQVPRSIFVVSDNKLAEIVNPKGNVIFSALVVNTSKGYRLLLLDRQLAGSIFVRLYFFDGMGLKYFRPFIEGEDNGNFIRVFNINW